MDRAVVWNAQRSEQYEGNIYKRYENGSLTIDLSNGIRYFATRDRIVSQTNTIEEEFKESNDAG